MQHLFSLANKIYERWYPLYYPLYLGWKIFSDRCERALFKKIIRPGMIVVDVGANVGIYTRFFSKLVGPHGKVHGFEPAPENFKRLEENTDGLPNVCLYQAAVGARQGSAKLYYSKEMNVDHRMFDSGDGRQSITVPMESLDDVFPADQKVDIIKIDVQGYELSVLLGAQRILKENSGIKVVMEYWPYGFDKASVEPPEVLKLLTSLGFEIRMTNNPSGETFNGDDFDAGDINQYCNLIIARDFANQI